MIEIAFSTIFVTKNAFFKKKVFTFITIRYKT